jgi:hypothetical protein
VQTVVQQVSSSSTGQAQQQQQRQPQPLQPPQQQQPLKPQQQLPQQSSLQQSSLQQPQPQQQLQQLAPPLQQQQQPTVQQPQAVQQQQQQQAAMDPKKDIAPQYAGLAHLVDLFDADRLATQTELLDLRGTKLREGAMIMFTAHPSGALMVQGEDTGGTHLRGQLVLVLSLSCGTCRSGECPLWMGLAAVA